MMRRAITIVLALTAPAHATAVSGPPTHNGPFLARFFRPIATVDGAPVLREEWRCWTGSEWLPFAGLACQTMIFRGKPPEPIPQKQRRME